MGTPRGPKACPVRLVLKRPPPPLERFEQEAFFQWVRYVKYRGEPIFEDCYAVPNGSFLAGDVSQRAIQGNALRRQGVQPGCPDINVDLPVGPYHGARIEMKRVGAIGATPEQKAVLERRRRRGYWCCVCHGFEEAKAALEAYLAFEDKGL